MKLNHFSRASILAGGLIGVPFTMAVAQQPRSNTSTGYTATDTGHQSRGFDWGWLGLLGLAGLAGLRGNKTEPERNRSYVGGSTTSRT